MTEDSEVLVQHILQSIAYIEEYVKDKSYQEFETSVQFQDSVLRRLEIIGEAVKHLSDKFKGDYPHLPWKKIAGMRDILIHEYFGVDLELAWTVVEKDLPFLKQELQKVI